MRRPPVVFVTEEQLDRLARGPSIAIITAPLAGIATAQGALYWFGSIATHNLWLAQGEFGVGCLAIVVTGVAVWRGWHL